MIENILYYWQNIYDWIIPFDSQKWTVVILATTLIVVYKYTCATVGLWKEAKFQSDLSISPMIILRYDEKSDDPFVIKNIGKGLAINIIVAKYTIVLSDMAKVYTLIFNKIHLLESGKEKKLTSSGYVNGKAVHGVKHLVQSYLSPIYQKKVDLTLTVEYQNALGHGYYTALTTGKSGLKIRKIVRKSPLKWLLHKLQEYFEWVYVYITAYLLRVWNFCKMRLK